MGDYQKALERYEKALQNVTPDVEKTWEKTCPTCSKSAKSRALKHIGITYQRMGRHDEALAAFQKGETVAKVQFKESIGNLYLDHGELDKAEPYLREASKLSDGATGALKGRVLARFHLLASNYLEAKEYYEALLKRSVENDEYRFPSIDNLPIAYTGLGKVYEGLEDYKKSEEYYEKATKLLEEIRSGLLPSEENAFFRRKSRRFPKNSPV